MPSTIDNIADGFPFPSNPPIVGASDYENISEVHLQLNSNAAVVHSNLVDGYLGPLYLTVLPAFYNTLSATTFTPPSNPGATPDIPVGSTAAQISALRYAHTTTFVLFDEYDHKDKTLCQQLLSAVDGLFVCSLWCCYVEYSTVLTRDIFDHLYAAYTNISHSELHEDKTHFRVPYDNNQTIEIIIN